MSFCRWSSDNFKCDVYCYEDVAGGFTTHVAGNRVVGDIPDCPALPDAENIEGWMELYKAREIALDRAAHEPIGLPHDGETFNDETLEDMRARLVSLKKIGYYVPDWVFADIDEELAYGCDAPQDTAS